MIDLTSSKSDKGKAARFVSVVPAVSKATGSIADRIAQHRSSSVPLVPKFLPKRPSGAKSSSLLERLTTMKSDNVPLPTKVAPKLVPSAAETDLSAKNKETARADNREKSTKSVYGEVIEICALLKPDLF